MDLGSSFPISNKTGKKKKNVVASPVDQPVIYEEVSKKNDPLNKIDGLRTQIRAVLRFINKSQNG